MSKNIRTKIEAIIEKHKQASYYCSPECEQDENEVYALLDEAGLLLDELSLLGLSPVEIWDEYLKHIN